MTVSGSVRLQRAGSALALLGAVAMPVAVAFAGCGNKLDDNPAISCQNCLAGQACIEGSCITLDAAPIPEASDEKPTGVACGMKPCEAAEGGILKVHAFPGEQQLPAGVELDIGGFEVDQQARLFNFGATAGVTLRTEPIDEDITAGGEYLNCPSSESDGSTAEFNAFLGGLCPDSSTAVLVHEYSPFSCDGGACPVGSKVRVKFEFERRCHPSVSSHICGCGVFVE